MTVKKMSKKAIEQSRREFYSKMVERVKKAILEVNPDYKFVIKRVNLDKRIGLSDIPNKDLKYAIKNTKSFFTVVKNNYNKPFMEKEFYRMLIELENVLLMQGKEILAETEIHDDDITLVEMMKF